MKYRLSLGLAVFLWSTSFPFIKQALSFTSPGPLLATRFIVAGFGAIALFAVIKRPIPWNILRRKEMWIMALSNALGFALQFFGQDLTSASKAALFINTYVIFVAIAAPIFLKERVSLRVGFGVVLGFIGAGIASTGLSPSFTSTGSFWGDLMCVGAALVYTVYIVLSKRLVDSGWDVLAVAFGTMVLTAPLTLPFSLIGFRSFGLATLSAGAYLGFFCSLFPFIFYIYSLKGISVTVSSVMLLGEVVLAMAWSFIFLDERFGPAEWLGTGLVLSAILLVGTRGTKEVVAS
ncbi:MAG: DMT family transporter [candidate division WOR-3 bacterium]